MYQRQEFISYLFNKFKKDKKSYQSFKKNIYLSYIGARICYSDKIPIEILEEDKFLDKDKRNEFFYRLYKNGHFSVFAHTPVRIYLPDLPDLVNFYKKVIHNEFFKLFIMDNYVYLTLRHFAEYLPEDAFMELIDFTENDFSITYRFLQNFSVSKLHNFECMDFDGNKLGNPVIYLLPVFGFDWFSVYLFKVSKTTTHQIVRHTILNFTQQSHRYVKINSITYPKELYGYVLSLTKVFKEMDLMSKDKIVNEDLKYLLPQGSSTNIMISGWRFHWNGFFNLRCQRKAQKEIREIANTLFEFFNITKI